MEKIDKKRIQIINHVIQTFSGTWHNRRSDPNCAGCVISIDGIIIKPFIHISTNYFIIYYEKDQSDSDTMSNHATVHNYECYIIKDEYNYYNDLITNMHDKKAFIEKLATINYTQALNGKPNKCFTGEITYEMSYTELRF